MTEVRSTSTRQRPTRTLGSSTTGGSSRAGLGCPSGTGQNCKNGTGRNCSTERGGRPDVLASGHRREPPGVFPHSAAPQSPRIPVVGLARQLSNPTNALERLLERKWCFIRESDVVEVAPGEGSTVEISTVAGAVQLHGLKRLKPQDIAGIVAGYQGGQNTTKLAEQFKVSRRTISKVLNREGVTLRARPLTERQIDQAALLYEAGLSLAKIGRVIGARPRTIQLRLRERGVVLRDTHGRDK